jgi:hypothetical protein
LHYVSSCLDPIHLGHANVHEGNVGVRPPAQFEPRAAIVCIADNIEVRLSLENHGERIPHQGLVIDNCNSDIHVGAGLSGSGEITGMGAAALIGSDTST